ncbi:carboxylesterase [Myxococcus stipitatus DSM 14675]|uniref:Carboxylic ester hydrolase n=1 Tax=Myxococcus stipitatus (strain DSM 14675 / JCM 12634 / Mx s8) TaxID=1278073 RepID=L7U7Q8_MYXSD|nr:carboxylesterase [Myxococcus stipitatus DSM 14675]
MAGPGAASSRKQTPVTFLRRRSLLSPEVRTVPLLALSGLLSTLSACDDDDPPVDPARVVTRSGPVRGTVTDEVRVFQGIPFAAPPVGDLRFRAPQPVAAWSEDRDATKPGNRCPQPPDAFGAPSNTEDCLFLNVVTPRAASPRHRRPVMVWIHGGMGHVGAGSDHDTRRLAQVGDVVVVSFNYRLGMLGNLSHPGFERSGHFVLEDQQAALRWVRDNIGAFGGDPGNVTLFGESAGATNVCKNIISPLSEGLFHRAIIQSGPCTLSWPENGIFPGTPATGPSRSQAETEAGGVLDAKALGCTDADPVRAAACLRHDVTIQRFIDRVTSATGLGGGYGLPINPVANPVEGGQFNKVPVLIGNTRDESRLFVGLAFDGTENPVTPAMYEALTNSSFGAHGAAVRARYPLSAFRSPSEAWAAVLTDRVWACTTLKSARLFASHMPVHMFEFADPHPVMSPEQPRPSGAWHGSDVAMLLWPVLKPVDEALFTPEQRALSDSMIRYWASFARTGSPNHAGAPEWPRYELSRPYTQSLAPGAGGIGNVDFAAEHHCDFWLAPPFEQ